MIGDFTTLANVKAWRSPALTGEIVDDQQLGREITAASEAIRQYVQRDLNVETYVEVRNGEGTAGMMLYQNPVIDVTAVSVNGVSFPAPTTTNSYGFVWDAKKGMLYLRGGLFSQGFQNVAVTYTAGYKGVPYVGLPTTGARIQTSALPQTWNFDLGVSYSSGAGALVAVPNSPAVGQYVAPLDTGGYYQFNIAEQAVSFTLGYSYTPKDVEEACINMVVLEYNRRNRIGENTKSLAGENISYYTSAALTPTIKSRLSSYVNVVPI